MQLILKVVGVICLLITLIIHGFSLFSGSSRQLNQNIYTNKNEQVNLTLGDIRKIQNQLRYFIYFLGMTLLWAWISNIIHFFFMFVAVIRYISVTHALRNSKEEHKELDKLANIAAVIHCLYTLFVVF